MEASMKGTATMVELSSGERLLVVGIDIDCPMCGQLQIQLSGHHLRGVRDLLIEFIDLHADLTGKDSDIRTIERLQTQGKIPENPVMN